MTWNSNVYNMRVQVMVYGERIAVATLFPLLTHHERLSTYISSSTIKGLAVHASTANSNGKGSHQCVTFEGDQLP